MQTFYDIIYGFVSFSDEGINDFLMPNLFLDIDNWLW